MRGRANDTHEENFVYQPTADDLSIKDGFADIKKLKGNTIVWNQKVVDYETNNSRYRISNVTNIDYSNNSFVLKSEAGKNIQFIYSLKKTNIIGHKLFIKFDLKTSETVRWSNIRHNLAGNFIGSAEENLPVSVQKDTFTAVKLLKTVSTYLYNNQTLSEGAGFGIYISNNTGTEVYVKNINIFDLTQMFGEGNEPTIEEFEAMFPNSYYEYNEGELISFDGKGVKSVGFNQWDEELVLGSISNNGNNANANDRVRTNYIKVLPNTTYYVSSNRDTNASIFISMYDNNKVFLRSKTATYKGAKITIDADVHYIRFYYYDETPSNIYNICINLSHSGYRNGEYEPYEDYTLSFLDGKTISQLTGKLNREGESAVIFPDGLRSAGTVYDEIVYDEATGKHKAIKRIGSVDMGTLGWTYDNSGTSFNFYAKINEYGFAGTFSNSIKANIVSAMYGIVSSGGTDRSIDKTIKLYNNYLRILDSSYTDANSLKTSLQGQILYYELAEPEVYELDFPINTSYEAYDFGTEKVLYNDDSEVNIPMKANIEYGFNAVDMIRNNFEKIRSLKEEIDNTIGNINEVLDLIINT